MSVRTHFGRLLMSQDTCPFLIVLIVSTYRIFFYFFCIVLEYLTNTLHYYLNELKANSEDDIRAGDETLNAIFDGDETLGAIFARCEDHALGVGGGAASAGRTAAPPQGGLSLADDDESGAASAPPTLPSGP